MGQTLSPDLRRLAGISDKTVKVWDTRDGQETLALEGHTNNVKCVAVSPDGTRLASGDGSRSGPSRLEARPVPGVVKVWDAQTGREILSLPGHACCVLRVVFSPDGKRLASASEDLMVKVWDAQTGRELLSLTPKERQVGTVPAASVAFSPDGKRLAGLTGDPAVKVWDAESGQELLSLQGGARGVAFSPDGKRLASVGLGVKVWDAQTGQELLSLKANLTDTFRQGLASVVTFSRDGNRLGRFFGDGDVTIWDATPLPEKP
jgi:WD40 repeat protein